MTDDDLDALIRRAADHPTDELRLAQRVQARLRTAPRRSFLSLPTLAPAGFAAILAIIPVAIVTYPASDPLDALISSIAMGEPLALAGDLPPVLDLLAPGVLK